MANSKPMKLLVVGSEGSIGTRRSMLLQEMGHKVVGIDPKKKSYFSQELAQSCDAAFLCVPPQFGPDLANQCAEAKVPFFLEKPGAVNFRDLLPVTYKCDKYGLVNMVCCNIRFTAEYKAIKESLPNIGKPLFSYAEFGYFLPFWRDGQYRTYYSCYRMSGGGILMDSIHELDYMFSLFGMPVDYRACVATNENTKELPELDAEDVVNLFITYRSGMSMCIHLDYLQRSYKRVFFAIGTKGRIDQTFNVQGANYMYKSEMQHFLDCVKSGEQTIKTVGQHVQVLEFVSKVRDSNAKS